MKVYLRNALLLLLPAVTLAQVPVDDDGNVVGSFNSQADIMPIEDYGLPRLSAAELQELVGPIALYPDDLLAIVLPASAYPLQIVAAARFLEALKEDPSLQPDDEWDDSIVALINYPEVIELLNNDLEWTWRLGEAVVAQQSDIIAAIENFRDIVYAAGNLKSDSYQTISNDDGVISITPTAEDVIYVPYYEPARVVYYQPRPVYYYHPHAYPVYYYPYAADHHFNHGFFWGVTTAFSIGWLSDSLHVYHHSYYGHPYYGRYYPDTWWYRRPPIAVYNTNYVSHNSATVNRYSNGDRWRAHDTRREYVRREGYARAVARGDHNVVRTDRSAINKTRQNEPISFRERDAAVVNQVRQTRRSGSAITREVDTRETRRQQPGERTQDLAASVRHQQAVERTRRAEQSRSTHREQPAIQRRDSNREQAVRQYHAPAPTRTERTTVPQVRRQIETHRQEPRVSAPRSQLQSSAPQPSVQRHEQRPAEKRERTRSHDRDRDK